jgi:hypothetical protein
MNIPRALLVLFTVLTGFSQAASVASGSLATDHTGPSTTSINTSDTNAVDLSDLSGLTPGQSIQISFTPNNPIAWEGSFFYNDGQLEIDWRAQIEISVGGETLLYTDLWEFSGPATGGIPFVGGSNTGPAPVTHWFVVPWGTDLSSVSITLRDLSSISGPGAGFLDSQMAIAGTLTTTTVPEPSMVLLCGLAPVMLMGRRRKR